MAGQAGVERRRGRRVSLQAPILIRRPAGPPAAAGEERAVGNISLAGAYFETERPDYAVNEVVIASIAAPETERREFPFTRLAGRGRIVRVQPLAPGPASGGTPRFGVAVEFGADVTALTTFPTRL